MRRLIALLGSCAFLASCGGDSSGGTSGSATPTPSPAPAPAPTPTPTPAPVTATVTYPHIFAIATGDGAQPNGPLMQASDGNIYGTTRAGGTHVCRPPDNVPCGTAFKMTPGGDLTVLYSFGASATDGYSPSAPLVEGSDGALYGTTASGGQYGAGTVFKLARDGTYTQLYSFGSVATDGAVPVAGLIQGRDGNLYGTTSSGGANHCSAIPQAGGNCGTVFKITPAGVETVLYSFGASVSDGVEPIGALVQRSDGNFYGTTLMGGANNCASSHDCGTVFRITPTGAATTLYSFGTSFTDGIAPQGTLIQGNDGAFYGTTVAGGGGRCGGSYGCGTVFRITSTGALTLLHAFALDSRADGDGPSQYLVQGTDGNFYGTTGSGGAQGGDLLGTIFRITPSGTKTTLYSFGPYNAPSNPQGGLIQARDGAFYGITFYNGDLGAVGARGGAGAVFKMTIQ